MIDTLNKVTETMNSEMRRFREEGQVEFRDLPNGAMFFWGMYSTDTEPKTKTSARTYLINGQPRRYRTGAKVLVRRGVM